MSKKLPKDLIPGDASNESIVHASDSVVGFSRGHKEGDISRLQSAGHNFDNTKQYKPDDIIVHTQKIFRNITPNTPNTPFDVSQWELLSGNVGGITELSELTIDADKDWKGKVIKNHGTPVDSTDVPNKEYVDSKVSAKDSLEELTDTEITSPQKDQSLVRNEDNDKWVNEKLSDKHIADDAEIKISKLLKGPAGTIPKSTETGITWQPDTGKESLESLTDVTITTPHDNEVITKQGDKWINKALPAQTPESLESLTDTEVTNQAKDQSLVRNEDNDKWVNEKLSDKHISDSAAITYSKLSLADKIENSDLKGDITISKLLKGAVGTVPKSTETGITWQQDTSSEELLLDYDITKSYRKGDQALFFKIIPLVALTAIPAGTPYNAALWGSTSYKYTQFLGGNYTTHVNIPASINFSKLNQTARGIVFANDIFWIVDVSASKVFAYDVNGNYLPDKDWNLAADNSIGLGITFADDKFWVTNLGSGTIPSKVFCYDGTEGNEGTHISSRDFDLHNSTLDLGIAFANNKFYVVDQTNNDVSVYTLQGSVIVSEGFNLISQNNSASAVTISNNRLLVMNQSTKHAYSYSFAGVHDSQYDVTLPETYSIFGFLYYDSKYWVIDIEGHKVDVFDSTAVKLSDKGFELATTYDPQITVPNTSLFHEGDFIGIDNNIGKVKTVGSNFIELEFSDSTVLKRQTPFVMILLNYVGIAAQMTGAIINYVDYTDGSFHITFPNLPPTTTPIYIAPSDLNDEINIEKDIFVTRVAPNTLVQDTRDTNKNFLSYQNRLYLATTYRQTNTEFENSTTKSNLPNETITLVSENADPIGITFANNKFYVVDSDAKVYVYDSTSKSNLPNETITLVSDNSSPTGITFANNKFYVVDSDAKVYVYDSTSKSNLPNETITLVSENADPIGITFANNKFYVVDSDDNVYVYNTTSNLPNETITLVSENANPSGILYYNERFYVVDNNNHKVYVYDSTTKSNLPNETFSLVSENANPSGILYYNERFYVVDSSTAKVYVYTTTKYWFTITPQTPIPLNALGNHIENVGDGVESNDATNVGQVIEISNKEALRHGVIPKYSESEYYPYGKHVAFEGIVQRANQDVKNNTPYDPTQWDMPSEYNQSGLTTENSLGLLGFSVSGAFRAHQGPTTLDVAFGTPTDIPQNKIFYIPEIGRYGFFNNRGEDSETYTLNVDRAVTVSEGKALTQILNPYNIFMLKAALGGIITVDTNGKKNLTPCNILNPGVFSTTDKFLTGLDGWLAYDVPNRSDASSHGDVTINHTTDHGGSIYADLEPKGHSYYYYGGLQKTISKASSDTWGDIQFEYRSTAVPQWNGVSDETATKLVARILNPADDSLIDEIILIEEDYMPDSGWRPKTIILGNYSQHNSLKVVIAYDDHRWLDVKFKVYLDNFKLELIHGTNAIAIPENIDANYHKRIVCKKQTPTQFSLVDFPADREYTDDYIHLADIHGVPTPEISGKFYPRIQKIKPYRDLLQHDHILILGSESYVVKQIPQATTSHSIWFSVLSGVPASDTAIYNIIPKERIINSFNLDIKTNATTNNLTCSMEILNGGVKIWEKAGILIDNYNNSMILPVNRSFGSMDNIQIILKIQKPSTTPTSDVIYSLRAIMRNVGI